jgi:hypothetical protein
VSRLRGRAVPKSLPSTFVVDVSDRQKLMRVSARGLERLVRRALVAEGAIARFVGIFTRWSATEAFGFRPLAFPAGISFIAVEA